MREGGRGWLPRCHAQPYFVSPPSLSLVLTGLHRDIGPPGLRRHCVRQGPVHNGTDHNRVQRSVHLEVCVPAARPRRQQRQLVLRRVVLLHHHVRHTVDEVRQMVHRRREVLQVRHEAGETVALRRRHRGPRLRHRLGGRRKTEERRVHDALVPPVVRLEAADGVGPYRHAEVVAPAHGVQPVRVHGVQLGVLDVRGRRRTLLAGHHHRSRRTLHRRDGQRRDDCLEGTPLGALLRRAVRRQEKLLHNSQQTRNRRKVVRRALVLGRRVPGALPGLDCLGGVEDHLAVRVASLAPLAVERHNLGRNLQELVVACVAVVVQGEQRQVKAALEVVVVPRVLRVPVRQTCGGLAGTVAAVRLRVRRAEHGVCVLVPEGTTRRVEVVRSTHLGQGQRPEVAVHKGVNHLKVAGSKHVVVRQTCVLPPVPAAPLAGVRVRRLLRRVQHPVELDRERRTALARLKVPLEKQLLGHSLVVGNLDVRALPHTCPPGRVCCRLSRGNRSREQVDVVFGGGRLGGERRDEHVAARRRHEGTRGAVEHDVRKRRVAVGAQVLLVAHVAEVVLSHELSLVPVVEDLPLRNGGQDVLADVVRAALELSLPLRGVRTDQLHGRLRRVRHAVDGVVADDRCVADGVHPDLDAEAAQLEEHGGVAEVEGLLEVSGGRLRAEGNVHLAHLDDLRALVPRLARSQQEAHRRNPVAPDVRRREGRAERHVVRPDVVRLREQVVPGHVVVADAGHRVRLPRAALRAGGGHSRSRGGVEQTTHQCNGGGGINEVQIL
eukprot:Rhum_TRINITY_DN15477_c0_g1::Rhum_TRINITY_DN15477_c0_g1_i1::g.158832::m.158832